jgi:large subunit ribosomal protein L3
MLKLSKGHRKVTTMLRGIWGKKVGMTQAFQENHKVVPVTIIDVAGWYVTQVKTHERDGYHAIQVGLVRPGYADQAFDTAWLQSPKTYFARRCEIRLQEPSEVIVGAPLQLDAVLSVGQTVDVIGTTIGRGFQGGVKRHGFTGGRGSHGDKLGRKPGSMGYMRSRGRVIKGKKLPGHMGVDRCMVQNLEVIRVEATSRMVLVKGSVPGKNGSLVYMRKCNRSI